jgi:hypothetical protein
MQASAQSKEEGAVIKSALTSADIRAILAGPATLNFGQVSASAEATNYFCVNNTLTKPVHVLVDACCHDHLGRSQHMSQVSTRPASLLQRQLAPASAACLCSLSA